MSSSMWNGCHWRWWGGIISSEDDGRLKRSEGGDAVLTVPEGTDQTLLGSMMYHLRYLQATSKSKATQKFMDRLADGIRSS